MRCNNCGWINPDDLTKCQKCNQPLVAERIVVEKSERDIQKCPECGYPVSEDSSKCPNCGYPVHKYKEASGSIDPMARKTQIISTIPMGTEGAPLNSTIRQEQPINSVPKQNPQKTVRIDILEEVDTESKVVEKKEESPIQSEKKEAEIKEIKKFDPKKTVLDFNLDNQPGLSEKNNPNTTKDSKVEDVSEINKTDKKEEGNKYIFECMDSESKSSLTLLSEKPLSFKDGDIIFVAGLRFKYPLK